MDIIMIDKQEIKSVATQIGIASNAESVILFGSYAKGNTTEESDVDLLIIAESELPRFKRSRALYKLLRPYPFAMDLVVYTPKEVEKGKASPVSFVSRALREGEVIYVRGS
jgi:uncharacterized protein